MPKPLPANRWPQLLLLVGVLFFCLTGWSVYRSVRGVSAVTDSHYYSHGLRYNASRIEKEAAEKLGWQVSIRLQDGYLISELTGPEGQPLRGVSAWLSVPGRGQKGSRLQLSESAAGRYGTMLPTELHGEVPALLTLSSGDTTLSRSLLLNL